jgi:hypothetical protein
MNQFKKISTAVSATAAVLLLVGCVRFFPNPPNNQYEYWAHKLKNNPTQINEALAECGIPLSGGSEPRDEDSSYNPDNGRAKRTECMFAKGFVLKSGFGGLCSIPEDRARLPACKDAPIRPREGNKP